MYNHSKKIIEGYDVHTLSDGNSQLQVVPQRGGMVSGLILDGSQILYMDGGTLYDTSKNIRGGIPILFPICGGLTDGAYTMDGKTYHMKQHGFARDHSWDIEDITANENDASMTIALHDDPDTYGEYPFHFDIRIKYTIGKGGLAIDTGIANKDDRPMPFCLGFHPYFKVSDKSRFSADIHAEKRISTIPGGIVDGKINYDADEVNISYRELKDNICRLSGAQTGLHVELGFDGIFKYVTLWSLKGRDFVCVEPWTAYADSMNTQKDLHVIEPGTCHNSRISICANKI